METIDYKEKYEQALEVAQRFYNNSVAVTKKGLEDIFPELKESGDDSVRKALIEFVQGMYTGCRTEEACKERDMYLAWLEKQGEHANFRNKIQIGDKVTRNEDGVLVNLSQLNRVAKKQDEQKPAWSEEDEKMLVEIVNDLQVCKSRDISRAAKDAYQKEIDWLKSLKDRVQPQPKQGWNEDTQQWIDAIVKDYEELYDADKDHRATTQAKISVLKSLKERYTWKPSESDIRILEQVIDGTANPINYHATLHAILEKLKKLREK